MTSNAPLETDPADSLSLVPDAQPLRSLIDNLKSIAAYAAAESVISEALREMEAAFGTEDSRLAPWLVEAGILHYELGGYDEAEKLLQRALTLESEEGRSEGPCALAALTGIARVQVGIGKLSAAEESAKRCLELSRELYGEENARHADDLSILAMIRIEQDRLKEAGKLLDTAIGLVEKQWGSEHEDIADLLEDRAKILNSLGKHNEALPLFERSLALKTERWGLDHPETAGPMLGLASIYNKKGEFVKAEAMCRQCLNVLESVFGPAHPRVAKAAIGLAACLSNLGNYTDAENILRRCLEATLSTNGEQNGQAGSLMLSLAETLAMLGQQVEATRLYRKAAAITEEVYEPDHTRTAAALSGLAHTERRMGFYPQAETLYRRCIQIIEQKHGSPHPDLIHYRCRLGMCLRDRKRLDESINLLERGIAEAAEIYGAGSYQGAIEERHLGLVLNSQKRWSEAYSIFKKSLATLEKYFGPNHPYLCKCLKGLSEASRSLHLLEEAHTHISRAVSLHEHVSGGDQYELCWLLSEKGMVELNMRMWEAAVETYFRATKTALAVLEDIYQVSSAREAIMYATGSGSFVRGLTTAAIAYPDLSDSTLAEVFSLVVRIHGQVLDWLAERQKFLELAADTSHVEHLRKNFTRATQRVADLGARGPEGIRETYLEELAKARREMEVAERALSAASEQIRTAMKSVESTQKINAEALVENMDPGATLIQFIHFFNPEDIDRSGRVRLIKHCGAFLLQKTGARAWDLEFVNLGSSDSLDSLIFTYRRAVDEIKTGQRPSARQEAEFRSVARRLYDRIWSPLMTNKVEMIPSGTTVDSAATVFLVLDKWLHLLDFNTLLSPAGELVIERWKLHLLSSAGDLVRLPQDRSCGTGLLAVGNPACTPGGPGKTPGEIQAEAETASILCAEAYRPREPLPGTEEETRAAVELFNQATGEPVVLLLGPEATEEAVKELVVGKRAVHIAAHGFFCGEVERETRVIPERYTNPLLMSGLVLASGSGINDGLLTAQEVIGLDLRGLDWVVLSACCSGLGRLFQGEGVFGLCRAFEIAGARTVVMALWRIDDTSTRELMEQIYRRRFAGSSTIDAIRQAQLERLRDQRRHLNRIHPILWGGIVAQGDWR